MYKKLVEGSVVTMNGEEARDFCDQYVQTLTEDGEVYIMPQDYPWFKDMTYTLEMESMMSNGLLVVLLS